MIIYSLHLTNIYWALNNICLKILQIESVFELGDGTNICDCFIQEANERCM